MTNGTARACAAAAAAVVAGLLSGCVNTVGGSAMRDPSARPWHTAITEADLDGLLLPVDELNKLAGSSDLSVNYDSHEFADDSDSVDDIDCVGAAYGAQQLVYGDSGWMAVRDQTLKGSANPGAHWLEQAVVLYPSAQKARNLLDISHTSWDRCVGPLVIYDSAHEPLSLTVGNVTERDATISQISRPQGASDGGCDHAMSVASDVVVETWVCGGDVEDEAVTLAGRIVAKIEKK